MILGCVQTLLIQCVGSHIALLCRSASEFNGTDGENDKEGRQCELRKRSRPRQKRTGPGSQNHSLQSPHRAHRASPDSHPANAPQVKSLEGREWQSWSLHADASPFPNFKRPTEHECEEAYPVLHGMHHAAVEKEFKDPNTPETIPHVLDAMIVAILSQATTWSNAKRAMNSMKEVYGSVFAYNDIMAGGAVRLQETIRCGGLHMKKTMIITSILREVQERHGKWDLDYIFDMDDKTVMKELLSYKYIGSKSAFVVMGGLVPQAEELHG